MEESKKLYNKRSRHLEYFLDLSKNPFMLLRWCEHFILNVASSDALFSTSIQNDAKFLFPDFATKIFQILEKYKELRPADVPAFFETFRTNKRQYQLFSDGHSKVKSFGMHYFCIAVDLINYKNNRIKWTLDYDLLIELGNKIGLTNLFPYESCHFQFIPVHMQENFREFYRNVIYCIQDLLNVKQDCILGPITQGQIIINHDRLSVYFADTHKLITEKNVTD